MSDWVYAIISPETDKLKVGITDNLDARLSKLRRSGPDGNLQLIRFFRGGKSEEKDIHEFLHGLGLHDHAEWFRYPEAHRTEILWYLDEFAKRINLPSGEAE